MKKSYLYGIIAIAILVGAAFTYPAWGPYLFSWLNPPIIDKGDAIPVFKVTDGISDAAFSPADASVKVYDAAGRSAMPTTNIPAMELLDTCSESPDGEFTGTISLPIGMFIYVYISGTNYYTMGVFCQVQALRAGTTGESEPILLKIYPNSGTIGNDISAMLVSGGAEIDSTSDTGNVSFGAASYRLDLTAADGYAFGNNDYVDPETGYLYVGTFVVFSLDLTTARATITSSHIPGWGHYTISSVEYWIMPLPGGQIINDDDLDDDGTKSLDLTIDVTVGVASAALDIEFYTVRRIDQMLQGSFGTSYEADDIDDLFLDTS